MPMSILKNRNKLATVKLASVFVLLAVLFVCLLTFAFADSNTSENGRGGVQTESDASIEEASFDIDFYWDDETMTDHMIVDINRGEEDAAYLRLYLWDVDDWEMEDVTVDYLTKGTTNVYFADVDETGSITLTAVDEEGEEYEVTGSYVLMFNTDGLVAYSYLQIDGLETGSTLSADFELARKTDVDELLAVTGNVVCVETVTTEDEYGNEQNEDAEVLYMRGSNAYAWYGSASLSVASSGLNEDMSSINGLTVKTIKDGTAPFDDDDEDGNDSSDSNLIVRTFDYVEYTLEYTTQLKDVNTTVDEAYMNVEFTIECDPSVAEFEPDQMLWCLNSSVTYYYDDNTSSTTWDTSKTVVKQVFSGQRYLGSNTVVNAIPGSGTLNCELYVKFATNDTKLTPTFTLWMEGNSESEKVSVTANEVTVSAEPRYDVYLVQLGNTSNPLAYYDLTNYKASNSIFDGYEYYGRSWYVGIGIRLYNTSAEKGLKGIEVCNGDITFDITATQKINGESVDGNGYDTLLWAYGILARSATSGTFGSDHSGVSNYGGLPGGWNAGTTARNVQYVYSGSNLNVIQDENNADIYHITVKNYQWDYSQVHFPTYYVNSTTTTPNISSNMGYFACLELEFITVFPTDVDTTSTLINYLTIDSFRTTSASGNIVTTEMLTNNNSVSRTTTLYPDGSYNNYIYYANKNYHSGISSDLTTTAWVGSSQDAAAYAGDDIELVIFPSIKGDPAIMARSINVLLKIDDTAIELVDGESPALSHSDATTTMFYAAKPDGTGWTGDTEMANADEDDLIYFSSLTDLESAGFTCVGVLYCVRDFEWTGARDYVIWLNAKIKDDVETGYVIPLMGCSRVWYSSQPLISEYQSSVNALAYGSGTGSYQNGYTTPDINCHNKYTRAVYENGSIVSGTTGGYTAGNSLLILGCKATTNIAVADSQSSSEGTSIKSVYDLDNGERTANFVITPTVTASGSSTSGNTTGATTNVTITVTVPEGLTYVTDSSNFTPVSVTDNSDGTQTIIWQFDNVVIGESMDQIIFATAIGEAGTENDVKNQDSFTVTTYIYADKDGRKYSTTFSNVASTSISVIKLTSLQVSKSVESPLVELGDTIQFVLHLGNEAEDEVCNAELFDILPYNGDDRGTDYSGAYTISTITVDFSSAKETYAKMLDEMEVYVTTSVAVRDKGVVIDYIEAIANDETLSSDLTAIQSTLQSLTAVSHDDTVYTITYDASSIGIDITGLYIHIPELEGKNYVAVYINLEATDGSGAFLKGDDGSTQQPGDLYENTYIEYAQGQASYVESNVVSAQVVNRTVSGLVWLDSDRDGLQDDTEEALSRMTVTLYRTTPTERGTDKTVAVTIDGISLYKAYTVAGSAIPAQTTGTDGSYLFTNLEAGDYYVVVTGVSAYGITETDAGSDDTIDSDATGVLDGSKILTCTYISGIDLPALADMTSYYYGSENNDTGLLYSEVVLTKVDDKTGAVLSGAVFVFQNAAGQYMTFSDNVYTGTSGMITSTAKVTTGMGGTFTVYGLPAGAYTLIEVEAPEHYAEADNVTVTIDTAGGTAEVTVEDTRNTGSITIIKYDSDGKTPLSGITFMLVSEDGTYQKEAETDSDGKIVYEDLDLGTYELTETATKEGYTLLSDSVTITLPLELTETEVEALGSSINTDNGTLQNGIWYFYDLTYTITNSVALGMPNAGAEDILPPIGIGCFVGVLFVEVWYVLHYRKRSIVEAIYRY